MVSPARFLLVSVKILLFIRE